MNNYATIKLALERTKIRELCRRYRSGWPRYSTRQLHGASQSVMLGLILISVVSTRYLDAHVMGGYNFLMANYRVGDKICLFGFSRGAYTARALAGMLTKIGLLPRDNIEQVPLCVQTLHEHGHPPASPRLLASSSVSAARSRSSSWASGIRWRARA